MATPKVLTKRRTTANVAQIRRFRDVGQRKKRRKKRRGGRSFLSKKLGKKEAERRIRAVSKSLRKSGRPKRFQGQPVKTSAIRIVTAQVTEKSRRRRSSGHHPMPMAIPMKRPMMRPMTRLRRRR